jgi:hypothetical protein
MPVQIRFVDAMGADDNAALARDTWSHYEKHALEIEEPGLKDIEAENERLRAQIRRRKLERRPVSTEDIFEKVIINE